MSCHPPSTKFLEREKDKIFKSSGFFRIEYVFPPLEKKKETWLRCSSRIPCLGNFPAGPFGFSIYTWWFFHQFFRPGVYIEATNHTLIISFPELKIRVRSFFPSWSHFQLSFFSLTLTNTFSNF